MIDADVGYENRAHFLAIAARTMRQILVDYGRARRRQKRGGAEVRVSLDDVAVPAPAIPFDVVALHEALERLAEYDPRKAQAVELRYFGGLSQEETAAALGISLRTVERDLRLARAVLLRDLKLAQ